MERGQFSKDFIFEVMKDSQNLREGYLAERERWLRSLAVNGREEVLFEFEMLLRGLERFFNLHNLPLGDSPAVIGRDFSDELRGVREGIHRAIRLTRTLLDEPSNRTLVFRRFVEGQLADDRARGRLVEEGLDQGTPQEGLFLLRQGFTALRGVVDALLKLPHTTFQVFSNVGELTIRQVALSRYFRPFRALEFRSEYDRIKSVRILDVLRLVPGDGDRKAISLAFLGLFRLLHYLRYVPNGGDVAAARRGYLVLALVNSEAVSLAGYFESEVPALAVRLPLLAGAGEKVAIDLRKEIGKLVRRDLAKATDGEASVRVRDAVIALLKQDVTLLAQAFDPTIEGTGLFDAYVSRLEQAQRLRLDLWGFSELARRAAEALALPGFAADRALEALRGFVAYFRDVSYQLLRYGDHDPFDRFVAVLEEHDVVAPMLGHQPLIDACRGFASQVHELGERVGRRTELRELPFDRTVGRALVERFLAPDAGARAAS